MPLLFTARADFCTFGGLCRWLTPFFLASIKGWPWFLNPAKQHQNENNDNHKAKSTPAIVAGSIKRTAPIPLNPPSKTMIKIMRSIVPIDMIVSPSG